METVSNSTNVKSQYKTSNNLNTRINIHAKYSTNKQGFGNWITSNYKITDGMKVLELGCGTGDMWKDGSEIIGRCSKFVLSDFSEGMIDQTKENLKAISGIEYLTIDIQDIPFEDSEFDVVIANMMLYHVPDLAKGLSEVRRVLKDGGKFYCATFGEHGIMEYITSLFGLENGTNTNFTLQNGESKLAPVFSEITRLNYEDSLAVTDVDDLVDYVCSLGNMSGLEQFSREKIREVLALNIKDGVLNVPKEYGMFVAS